MGSSQTVYMTTDEVRDRALPILQKRLGKFGFAGDVTVAEEEDFDGAYIFRMTARVAERVPARVMIDTLGEIHLALRKDGEDRFVYLDTERPGVSEINTDDEDVE